MVTLEAAQAPPLRANASFRTLWAAQFVSVLGDFVALFGVISFITFRLHGRPSDVTTVVLASTLPLALVTPFTGAVADRAPIERVLVASDLLRAETATPLEMAGRVGSTFTALYTALAGLLWPRPGAA